MHYVIASASQGIAVASARSPWAFAALAGSVLGAALQLHQPTLWTTSVYVGGLVAAGLCAWFAVQLRDRLGRCLPWLALAFGAVAGFGLAGARAAVYVDGALDP
ncbi:MAG: competence protein ComEC, partial [Comamonadaceae bacterium]